MPLTITAFNVFTGNTLIKSTEVNANFNSIRGHRIPIDPNTAASANETYDLGSPEYKWRSIYVKNINAETAIFGHTSVSGSYTIGSTDHDIYATASATSTIFLPTASAFGGYEYMVKLKILTSTAQFFVSPRGGNLEGTSGSFEYFDQLEAHTYKSDGTDWWII